MKRRAGFRHSSCPQASKLKSNSWELAKLFETLSFQFLWNFIILLFASNAGINQVQSKTAPITLSNSELPPSPVKYGIVIGGQPYLPSSSSSGVTGTTYNSNNSSSLSANLTDFGDSPFENNTFTSTTVPIGDTAFLKCSVKNLGNRTISWIRRRDMHIITVDRIVYTNDERFNILHMDGSEDWTLQIKYVQKRDNGTYECQVSCGRGLSSFAVHVFVAVPEAFILGNGEYHIQQGSTINLVCIVEKSPKPPEYIFWYHNERMINYGSTRDLSIQTETGSKTQSRLIIENAQMADSGNYTCETANAEPASTLVYISQGDKMAAIQRRKSDGALDESSAASSSVASVSSSAHPSSNVIHSMEMSAILVSSLVLNKESLLFLPSTISSLLLLQVDLIGGICTLFVIICNIIIPTFTSIKLSMIYTHFFLLMCVMFLVLRHRNCREKENSFHQYSIPIPRDSF